MSRKRKKVESGSSEPEGESGIAYTARFQESDFICPVCLDILKEVHITVCGHSFCYRCITTSLDQAPVCPVCKATLPLQNPIHPNVSLNDLVTKYSNQATSDRDLENQVGTSVLMAIKAVSEVDDEDMDKVYKAVKEIRRRREKTKKSTQDSLLALFLEASRQNKLKESDVIKKQLEVIETDLATVKASTQTLPLQNIFIDDRFECLGEPDVDKMEQQKLRMMSNFSELLDSYFTTRIPIIADPSEAADLLPQFSHDLAQSTMYSSLHELASFKYCDQPSSCSIVSSIELDTDCELFAVAGVTKKIKIYSLRDVIRNVRFQNHLPIREMECNAKLSSVCFNPCLKAMLVSSDYEGCVNVWDVQQGSKVTTHQEHGKRVWSVMFNPVEPQLFASGSDDGTVKLWCNNRQHSIHTLDTKANVCCVRFHPTNRYYLAYGSADHAVHYVDLRYPGQQLLELKGHRKAVSYVQFINENEIVSASTDSELKLWNANTGQFVRTYKGHMNEKNFVGLSVCRDFISCGSENNCLYVYGKHVSKPMITFNFKSSSSSLPDTDRESPDEFVSAVCWKKDTGMLIGANSQGIVKVLEMR